ncbi:type IX secretion system protein PorD [Polaribacter sp. P097]|uniref:type IX secretion system protein PorD n=1 Tax=Polaribacter sp. P097 TaxID=3117398 RepID=UPI002FE1F714
MRKLILLLTLFFVAFNSNSQELNCLVKINYEQIAGSNRQVFVTLENALSEFINKTKWTERVVQAEERVDCTMNIIITSRNDNTFNATIQVQSSRPIYGSSYLTPILNIKDNDFTFRYNEFDPLNYNRNAFDSNLISTIVFYVYTILGVDADTFSKFGGDYELKEAQNVMLQAQQSGIASWQNVVGKQNRYLLIDNLLAPKLKKYREVMYDYHIKGMDNFVSNKEFAKQTIETSVLSMEQLFNKTVGNYLIRIFFDAKANEIVNIYSDGPRTKNSSNVSTTLKRISPNNNAKWRNIE